MNGEDAYFADLAKGLKRQGIDHPVLVLDLDRLDQNIDTLLEFLPAGMAYRIVAKSLPSPKLINYVRRRADTDRLMTFNLPMLIELANQMPNADQLLGKPLPAAALEKFHEAAPEGAIGNVFWLIDTPERLLEYQNSAQQLGESINVVFEIDVGLHRGGFEVDDQLLDALKNTEQSNALRFRGFMGYEPHLASIPKTLGWRNRAQAGAWQSYKEAIKMARDVYDAEHATEIVRNIAGSPTFRLYEDTTIGNEVSVGSALVKPTDFDTDLLEPFVPACFIATPVIKAVGATRLPALEFAKGIQRAISPQSAQSFFIHGGKWMANPVFPRGLSYNSIFGRSSNQEMLNGPSSLNLDPGDYVFFRPHQSEAVFLQFGDLITMRNGVVTDRWPSLPVSA